MKEVTHMKWFNTTNPEEAKKEYRKLARKYHPDLHVGAPDYEECEEVFKEIASEYAAIVSGRVNAPAEFDEDFYQSKNVDALMKLHEVITELYPRLKVNYVAWVLNSFIEFDTPPIRKICHCLELAIQFIPYKQVYATFIPKNRKKRAEVWYDPTKKAFYIDCKPEDVNELLPPTITYPGRRYTVYQSAKWQKLEDDKTGTRYFLKRSPKLKIEEMFGL